MIHLKKRIFSVVLFSALFAGAIVPNVAYATEAQPEQTQESKPKKEEKPQTGTTLIAVSASSLNVGESLSVTIRGSISSTLTLKFNPAILRYESSNPSASISDNVITFNGKESVIKFTAIEAGSSGLILGGTNMQGCSTIIQVADATESTGESDSESETDVDTTEEESEPVSSTTFGTAERYISIMEPEELPADGLESRKLETTEGTVVDAYQLENGSNEFYYMYGMDEKENLGWFIYDSSEQTISRIDATLFTAAPVVPETEFESKDDKGMTIDVKSLLESRKVWAVIIFVGAAIIAIIINVIVRAFSKDEQPPADESDKGVSGVHRSYEDHESAAMIPETPAPQVQTPPAPAPASAPVNVPEPAVQTAQIPPASDSDDDGKYNLTDEKKEGPGEAEVDELIGEKRLDIMDLNDL